MQRERAKLASFPPHAGALPPADIFNFEPTHLWMAVDVWGVFSRHACYKRYKLGEEVTGFLLFCVYSLHGQGTKPHRHYD